MEGTRNLRRRSRRTKAQRGLTLMELMIALGIMAVGMLSLLVSQLHAIRQSSQGHHTTDSANIARSHLEMVQRLPWTTLDAAAAAGDWTTTSWPSSSSTISIVNTQANGGGDAVAQDYTVLWKVADVGTNTCLRDVDVQIQWTDKGYERGRAATLSTRRYNWGGAGC